MKTIYKIGLTVCCILPFVGCMDQLDKDPIGLITPEMANGAKPTNNTVQASVKVSYKLLSSTLNIIGEWGWDDGTVTRNDFVVYDIGSDDVNKKWLPDGDQSWMDEVHNYNFIASNAAFNGVWAYLYDGVARSNKALSSLNDDALMKEVNMDPATLKRLKGETHFLRAFYYFDLVTNFGDVPLLTEPIISYDDAFKVIPRVDKAEIWKFISDDLAKAKEFLPDAKYSVTEEPWRASLGAVLAMQAKVALYNNDFAQVKQLVSTIESKGFFALNDNYFNTFSVGHEFTENEVIFAYDHQSVKTPSQGNGLCALLGWGFVAPTPSLISEFEPNDPRKDFTFDVNKKIVYKILGDTTITNQGNEDSPSNKIYIRYADVLLWKAEALIETGDIAGGIAIINKVRARARNTVRFDGKTKAPAGTLPDRLTSASKEDAMKWLRHERRVELAFESHRFRDLKRWGIAKEVLNANGQGFTDRNSLFPIPQRDIDRSGTLLSQNPGY